MIACRHDSRLVQHEVIASIKDKMRRYAFCQAENPFNCRVYSTIPVPGHFQQTTSGEGTTTTFYCKKNQHEHRIFGFLEGDYFSFHRGNSPFSSSLFGQHVWNFFEASQWRISWPILASHWSRVHGPSMNRWCSNPMHHTWCRKPSK